MDYITRKSCTKQYGSVGTWSYAGRGCSYPCISALGVRNPTDRQELNEALSDLDLEMPWETPAEVEAMLGKLGSPEILYQRTHTFLESVAARSLFSKNRKS